MAFRGLLKIFAVLGFTASSVAALAQSPECNRYRAELAALERGGVSSPTALRLQQELSRMQDYYRTIGCERRGFLFSSPPEECPSIAQRIRNLSTNLEKLESQGSSQVNVEARRQQLIAAINQSCTAGDNRNFFERLFGAQPQAVDPNTPISEEPGTPQLGGSKTVCVRTCDGYYFPLATAGSTSPDTMCQALCPGAETKAFSMPASDDGLTRAISVSTRTPYTSLPNAFRFQKNISTSCYCKTDEQKWSDVLQRAEQLLDQRDTIISAERAEELSRAPAMKNKQAALTKQMEQAEQAAAREGQAAPTAGSESAGIGPQSIEASRVVGRNEGLKIEGRASDGSKRTIRVITPSSVPSLLEGDISQ